MCYYATNLFPNILITVFLYNWFSLYSSVIYFIMFLLFSCSVVSNSLQPHGLQHARLLCPWDFPGKNTGVDCHLLIQGTFPAQGLNGIFCIGRQTLYH